MFGRRNVLHIWATTLKLTLYSCFVWLLRRHYIVAELRRRWYTVLFVLEISLIAAGLCIIAAIMVWPFQGEASNAKVISGFATGVLIDFIGVIFVSMYNRTLESSLQMSSLINDNRRANFGFFIASQIHNADVRDQTLSKMTANMFSRGNEEQKTEEKQE